jgi:RNA polymerase sigma-70 factor, ECF subfamily
MTRKRLRTLQVRPWLYKIVLHAALDYLRAQSKQFSVEDPNSWLHRKSNYDNPEQLVLYAEDSEDLERLLAMLPESYRDMVKDVVLRARSYDIVAREYGMKLNAVRTCYHRAIRRLAEVVRQERLTEKDLRRWLEAHLITTSDTGSPYFDMNMPRDFW